MKEFSLWNKMISILELFFLNIYGKTYWLLEVTIWFSKLSDLILIITAKGSEIDRIKKIIEW